MRRTIFFGIFTYTFLGIFGIPKMQCRGDDGIKVSLSPRLPFTCKILAHFEKDEIDVSCRLENEFDVTISSVDRSKWKIGYYLVREGEIIDSHVSEISRGLDKIPTNRSEYYFFPPGSMATLSYSWFLREMDRNDGNKFVRDGFYSSDQISGSPVYMLIALVATEKSGKLTDVFLIARIGKDTNFKVQTIEEGKDYGIKK